MWMQEYTYHGASYRNNAVNAIKFFLTIERQFYYAPIMEAKRRTARTVEKMIAAFFRESRRMPTYAEMVDLFGVRSKSVVHFWVKKLLAEGLLEKDARGFLRPLRRTLALPMVGEVAAGFPSPAEEELRDIISFDEYLVTRPESSFLLKVSGDSMEGEGIREGDLVIVERGRDPKNGDIIVAEVDGEWTIKYFRKQGKNVILEAANPKYQAIRPKTELRLGGVVTAVIRKYHR
jgi:SOS regulatory protein LexA